MKGLLLLNKPYVAGARDSEKTFNPDITEVKVILNGIPNKVYSQGIEKRYVGRGLPKIWKGKQHDECNRRLYAGDGLGLFIALRSMRDNDLHGSDLRLVNTKQGV